MEAATPLDTTHMENAGTPASRTESLVTDDRTIYDELIAPLETTMMRSIWRIVRNADLAEDSLQDALTVIWKKRLQIRRHPNPPAMILKICLDSAYNTLRRLERMRRQTGLSQLEDAPAGQRIGRIRWRYLCFRRRGI
jgi:DNA-directed RNA polymerase specialized sigma24 family protein